MFSLKKLFSGKKEILLVCFDIDNTLCDTTSSEVLAEVHVAELIAKDISDLQTKIVDNKSRKKSDKKSSSHKNDSKSLSHSVLSSCSPNQILKVFNDVKKFHLFNDSTPSTYSRAMWLKETLERLDETTCLGISVNTLILKSKYYESEFWKFLNKDLKNYSNTIFTLENLKSKGLKLAVISDSDGVNGMKNFRIKNLGLEKYFDYIITSDDTGANKPDEINWKKLLELSGVNAKNCMMIGDHPNIDLITAKKLGFITVWTKQSLMNDLHEKYVDYEIKDISELVGIVENING